MHFKYFCLTNSIKLSISSDDAPPSFTKKLQCFDILAYQMINYYSESLINSQAFLSFGFLKVLPQGLI